MRLEVDRRDGKSLVEKDVNDFFKDNTADEFGENPHNEKEIQLSHRNGVLVYLILP